MIEVNVGPLDKKSSLYKRISRDVSIAVVNTFVENDFLTGKYQPIVKNMMDCVDAGLRDDIAEVVGLDFLENKFVQLISSIRNPAVITLDVFNQYLLKILLESSENYKEISDPPLQEHFEKSLEKFASVHGKGEQYGLYKRKTEELYRFTCNPWMSLTDEKSLYCGILFTNQDFNVFETEDFRTALCLMASSEAQAGTLYYGEDYVARMLRDGGVKAENISSIFSDSPFDRTEPVDKDLLDTLFDEVMGDVMEKAEQGGWGEKRILEEIDRQFGGIVGRSVVKERKTATSDEEPTLINELIYFCLIPYKGNEKMLNAVPHRRYMDFAITYHQHIPEEPGSRWNITNKILRIHNALYPQNSLSEERLYQLAMKNTKHLFPCNLVLLRDTYVNSENFDELTSHDTGIQLCTLFNSRNGDDYVYLNTAYVLLCPELLEQYAQEMGTDFYIMTFTKQQCILCPSYVPVEHVRLMHETNMELLSPEERMTSNIYFYSRQDKALSCLMTFSLK